MTQAKEKPMPYTDVQRMELRSYANLAGEVVARLWPMRTFISRNPLQGLESLSFDKAVSRGEELFSGRGYLSSEAYRDAFRSGRIQQRHLDEVLRSLDSGKEIVFGDRRLSHLDLLRAAMVHGVQPSSSDRSAPAGSGSPREDATSLAQLTQWITAILKSDVLAESESLRLCEPDEWPYRETMATWCDRTIGTDLDDQINRQLIKWSAAFCDEGEATWSMPRREGTFFRAWKTAAQHDLSLSLLGIDRASEKISALSDRPEDALLESLERLKVPTSAWEEYLSRHVAALPGWAGFIKWRAEQTAYPWQEAYRIDLVKYLAVRLFYERELVDVSCRNSLNCSGNIEAIQDYARRFPHAVWFRRTLLKGQLPKKASADAARLQGWWRSSDAQAWEDLGRRWYGEHRLLRLEEATTDYARTLLRLAEALDIPTEQIVSMAPGDLRTLLHWFRAFPEQLHGSKWLEAYERSHQAIILRQLDTQAHGDVRLQRHGSPVRPPAQLAFCIDVRSEVFRRHLEQRGGYETFGFAGFFGLPVAYRALGTDFLTDLCPVLLKPKHIVREIPRTYQNGAALRRKSSSQMAKVGHDLLQDLKHNVVTPYVMVEAIGWLFGLPLLGKTLCPRWYHRVATWLKHLFMPEVATTLTVDKLPAVEAEEMVAAEQRIDITRWLRARFDVPGHRLTADRLEGIRRQALGEGPELQSASGDLGHLLALSTTEEEALIEDLRRECRITPRGTAAQLARIAQRGFTLTEQAYYVETSLRLMGLTSSWSRLVILCGHGSTSQNNPYESALDCGACGGSHGLPNARMFAMIANRPHVRELLAKRGLSIPADTHFLAALHDTTTDHVRIADLEDVPPTHRKELAQVLEDVNETGSMAAAERGIALQAASTRHDRRNSLQDVQLRSMDWAQVRPEWGLARNSLFIIGSRQLTQGVDLEGRSFLHSYDHRPDLDGKLLEIIMTAPLIVAQWINLEYYFSTVDPETYGSGSKVYHNVTGRIGVMTGGQSDLRMGLPVQTVMNGPRPYHEPMRLTAIIEAPRDRISSIINRQPLLQGIFNNRWLHLIAYEPSERRYYRYEGAGEWVHVTIETVDNETAVAGERA
ncbi:MAG: DUF2309 domain-containing protein [Nitrospirota bacterium]|nr:DUF2309 domain-containing protein [Nitrospirota bacterium]MDP2384202.1 DUF2309 domain-containing protein [Nitrospirota bacterium]